MAGRQKDRKRGQLDDKHGKIRKWNIPASSLPSRPKTKAWQLKTKSGHFFCSCEPPPLSLRQDQHDMFKGRTGYALFKVTNTKLGDEDAPEEKWA